MLASDDRKRRRCVYDTVSVVLTVAQRKRVELDIEEARLQAEKRKELLDRAKMQQYAQNDRVKKFDSAVLQAEMVREREQQLKHKGKR